MMKLRARSRSFGSKDDTRSPKTRGEDKNNSSSSNSDITTAKDDINIKPSNSSSRADFPLELARSLQSFAASLALPPTTSAVVASTSNTSNNSKEAHASLAQSTSRPQPTSPPLKPILRSSTTSTGQRDGRSGTSSHSRQSSSTSSTGSSKQISFLLPDESTTPTRTGAAAASQSRYAAPQDPRAHSRQNSASSTGSSPSSRRTSNTSTSTSSSKEGKQPKQEIKRYASAVPVPGPLSKPAECALPQLVPIEEDVLHNQRPPSIMHIRRVSDTPEERRSSIESLSKELPPLPLNASAPASSISSRNSSRQSGHVRGASASSAASSVLSNPIHLPRLKLGEPSLGFPVNLLQGTPDSPASAQRSPEDRTGQSPFDDKRFSWMGMGRKRDSSESKRSSKRRSDTSVVGSLHSLPMNKHQRSRSSQLDVVHESETIEFTMHRKPLYTQEVIIDKPAFERNLTSTSKDEAARMTQLWVNLLEDFVLLCDDPSVPSSNRSSISSMSSSFVAPPSPLSSALLIPPPTSSSTLCPLSPSPSSECDPFLRLPRSARQKYSAARISKPLPPSPMPSLYPDDSAGSTTTYTQSPSTPAEELAPLTTPPIIPARASFNPFEASFSSADVDLSESTPSSPEASTSYARRASLQGTLAASNPAYGQSRPGKSRPPPLQLSSIPDSNETIFTAVPPQTEAQTQFYTSQRSRSLPTSNLEPGSYRQPISPSKRDWEHEQLGSSTGSNGSNRASRRYHFPSATTYGPNVLNASTSSSKAASGRRNKSIDEGYEGTGLTPTPTSDTFSIPSRSRETSISSTSANSSRRRSSSANTAETSLPSPTSAESFTQMMLAGLAEEGKRTPENSFSSSQNGSDTPSSNQSTPNANRRKESKTRNARSQSASEHVRKRSHDASPTTMKRSPTLEIVMYGVAL